MAALPISELPAAATLTGAELVPVVQGGGTVQTTAQAIADLGGGSDSVTAYGVFHSDGSAVGASHGILSVEWFNPANPDEYLVTFEVGFFSGPPAVTVTVFDNGGGGKTAYLDSLPDATQVYVDGLDAAGAPSPIGFSIIAIGPGGA